MISILLMEEILLHLGWLKLPINDGIIIILGGAGFQPSTTVGSMYDLFASPLGMGATELFLLVFLANLSAAFLFQRKRTSRWWQLKDFLGNFYPDLPTYLGK